MSNPFISEEPTSFRCKFGPCIDMMTQTAFYLLDELDKVSPPKANELRQSLSDVVIRMANAFRKGALDLHAAKGDARAPISDLNCAQRLISQNPILANMIYEVRLLGTREDATAFPDFPTIDELKSQRNVAELLTCLKVMNDRLNRLEAANNEVLGDSKISETTITDSDIDQLANSQHGAKGVIMVLGDTLNRISSGVEQQCDALRKLACEKKVSPPT